MNAWFLTVFQRSVTAGWMILAVVILRLFLKKAPRWITVVLWGLVALRLLCPVLPESPLSLTPEPVDPVSLASQWTGTAPSAAPSAAQTVTVSQSAGPISPITVATAVWLSGAVLLLLWAGVSALRLHGRMATAVRRRNNVYESEYAASPFLLGLVRPRIYVPFHLPDDVLDQVVAHEQAHLRRRDHWWKLLGFLLLAVHWFHPLLWVAYLLLCRDLELACDEAVIRDLDAPRRAAYTEALVACSIRRRSAASPLAFGEVGVRERVRSIMDYRKPAMRVLAAALAVCAVAAVCFLTDPLPSRTFPMAGTNVADLDPSSITDRITQITGLDNPSQLLVNVDNFECTLTPELELVNDEAIRFFYQTTDGTYSAQLRLFTHSGEFFVTEMTDWPQQERIYHLQDYLEALRYLPGEAIRQLAPEAGRYLVALSDSAPPADGSRTIAYGPGGVHNADGWRIHLTVFPMTEQDGAWHGEGDDVLHLLYG